MSPTRLLAPLLLAASLALGQGASESLEREAETARKAGRFKEAAAKFESAAAAASEADRRSKMEIRAANSHFNDKNLKACREAIRRALAADPELAAFVPEFYSQEFGKEVEDTRRAFRPVPTPAPADLGELKRAAAAKLTDGLASDVIYDLTAVPRETLDPEAVSLLARAYEMAGKPEEAAKVRTPTPSNPSAATPTPVPTPAVVPGSPATARPSDLLVTGREALMRGDTLAAQSAAYKTLEGQPTSSEAYRLLADAFAGRGEKVMAEANWKQSLKYDEKNESTLLALADFYLGEKSLDQALSSLKRAAEVNPANGARLLALGRRARAENDLPMARQVLQAAAAAMPADVAVLTEYASVLVQAGDLKSALDPLIEAVARDPRRATTRANLASVYRRKGQVKEAEREYREALRAEPDYLPALRSLALLLLEQGSGAGAAAEAAEHLKKALAADPKDVETVVALGRALARAGRLEEAAGALAQAKDLDQPAIWNEIGAVALERRRYSEAAEAYGRVLAKDPEYPSARTNLERARAAETFLKNAAAEPPKES